MTTEPGDPTSEERERISALLDAELEGEERERAFRELAADGDLSGAWERYHLIGACLRHERVNLRADIAAHVAERLAGEAVHDTGPDTRTDSAPPRRLDARYPLALAASVLVLIAGGLMVQYVRVAPEPTQVAQAGTDSRNVTRWQTADPRHEDALNAFLVEHSEFTSPPGMNGLASYAKFVSYDTAR